MEHRRGYECIQISCLCRCPEGTCCEQGIRQSGIAPVSVQQTFYRFEVAMKFCVLKPVVWNTRQYKGPCGSIHRGKNFVAEKGYGHEEWNNSPSMKHENVAYFHSESLGTRRKKATGNLCIIFIANYKSVTYIVGCAAGVSENNEGEEMECIAKKLNKYEKIYELWNVPIVKEKFDNNFEEFKRYWNDDYLWIRWSCPMPLFHWFEPPIRLDIAKVTQKQRVVTMFSSYQDIPKEVALDLLSTNLGDGHPILTWLTEGDFENTENKPSDTQKEKYDRVKRKSGSNRPAQSFYDYWVLGKREIYPKHSILQDAFVSHLKSSGIEYRQNINYIDLIYKDKNRTTLVEVKPCAGVGTKYAIRMAIGQLLEYKYNFKDNMVQMHIVLDEKPTEEEIGFVKSIGMLLSYRTEEGVFVDC